MLANPELRAWVSSVFAAAVREVFSASAPLKRAVELLAWYTRPPESTAAHAPHTKALLDRFYLSVHALFFASLPPHLSELQFLYFDEQFAIYERVHAPEPEAEAVADADGVVAMAAEPTELPSAAATSPLALRTAGSPPQGKAKSPEAKLTLADDDAEMDKENELPATATTSPAQPSAAASTARSPAKQMQTQTDAEALGLFVETCTALQDLRWLGICEQSYSETLFARIEQRIVQRCTGDFGQPLLEPTVRWVEDVVCGWLHMLLCPANSDSASGSAATSLTSSMAALMHAPSSAHRPSTSASAAMFVRASTPTLADQPMHDLPLAQRGQSTPLDDRKSKHVSFVPPLPFSPIVPVSPSVAADPHASPAQRIPASDFEFPLLSERSPMPFADPEPVSLLTPRTAASAREQMRSRALASSAAFLQWKSRLLFFAYERFGALRISELLHIINEHPQSSAPLLLFLFVD